MSNIKDISPATLKLIEGILGKEQQPEKKSSHISLSFADPQESPIKNQIVNQVLKENKQKDAIEKLAKNSGLNIKKEKNTFTLTKSMSEFLDSRTDEPFRLAFTSDPQLVNKYSALYKRKLRFLPDDILKRLAVQDHLLASVMMTRAGQISPFGRRQPNRFATGYKCEITHLQEELDNEGIKKLVKAAEALEVKILNCGNNSNYSDPNKTTFSEFLAMGAKNALTYGRIAVEVIRNRKGEFHSFRNVDASTIFRVAGQDGQSQAAAAALRKQALKELKRMNNTRLDPDKFENGQYEWIQVINGMPEMAFTSQEMLVHNFYPTTDVEMDGYPITPIDTVVQSVTTHINIGKHNALYFLNGRAARGMLIIQTSDVGQSEIEAVRQHFQASINSVTNSWRMPVITIGQDDKVTWNQMDNSGRDMEFQYLADQNIREILAAFQMSPDEIPGYSHLSKGPSAPLSESSNEYKLHAHQDAGLRPLLSKFQDFINQKLLPIMDPQLSKFVTFKFIGLDVETADQETARLTAEMDVHLSMDDIYRRVNKPLLGQEFGGDFPLNPKWRQVLYENVPVGKIMEHFFGIKGAAADPRFDYIRDPFYFQNKQLMQIDEKMRQAAEQQAQAQAMAERQDQAETQGQSLDQSLPPQGADEFESGDDELIGIDNRLKSTQKSEFMSLEQYEQLLKSASQLSDKQKTLLNSQNKLVDQALKVMEAESKEVVDKILSEVEKLIPPNKKR